MKIKDLPKVDRPREKLQKYGPEKLSDEELLAIILRTGRKGANAVQLARSALAVNDGKLRDASLQDIMKVSGLGTAKASEVIACMELGRRLFADKKHALLLSPEDVWRELADLRDHKKEHFVIFFLDARNQKIARSAAHIILAHNHPSGDPEPSHEDIRVTEQLQEAGKILGIAILDHVVVASAGFKSMKSCGLLRS